MANYTVTLGHLMKRGWIPNLDDYPIFDEDYRPHLNMKIIDHYYFREIGQETPDRFNFFLSRKMREIMPYYNQLYRTELINFDPLATEFFSESIDSERANIELNKHSTVSNTSGTEDLRTAQKQKLDSTVNETGALNDIGNSTDNFTQNRSGDKTTTQTNSRNEDLKQNSTNNTDQTDSTKAHISGTDTEQNNGNNTSIFSDIPQSNINLTITQNANGTTTIGGIDYATTITNNADTRKISRTHEEDSTGSLDRNISETGNVTNDNLITENNKQTEPWTEETTSTDRGDTTLNRTTKGDTVTDSTVTQNLQSGTTKLQDEKQSAVTRDKRKQKEEIIRKIAGRRGVSPSDLIEQYRKVLLNIDMLIINDISDQFINLF